MWPFRKRKKKRTAGGSSVAEQRAYNSQGEGAIPSRPTIECTPLCPPDCRRGELCTAGLVNDTPDPRKYDPFVVVEEGPIIHNVTGSIDWREHDIGTRYGPARCNETCTEPHAFGVKTATNTVSFERPCETSDAGAAEWRARQKR